MAKDSNSMISDILKILLGGLLGFLSAYLLGVIQFDNEQKRIKAEKVEEAYDLVYNSDAWLKFDYNEILKPRNLERKETKLKSIVGIYFPELTTKVDSLIFYSKEFQNKCIENRLSLEVQLTGNHHIIIRDLYETNNQSIINKTANSEVLRFIKIREALLSDFEVIGQGIYN